MDNIPQGWGLWLTPSNISTLVEGELVKVLDRKRSSHRLARSPRFIELCTVLVPEPVNPRTNILSGCEEPYFLEEYLGDVASECIGEHFRFPVARLAATGNDGQQVISVYRAHVPQRDALRLQENGIFPNTLMAYWK